MAEVLISPGVLARENDQSFLEAQPVQAGAAIVGPTKKGPVGIPTLVTTFSDYKNVFGFPSMDSKEKLHHIDLLERLIDKQKILYTRLSLSDDPDAKIMKDKIVESASMMGLPRGTDMSVVFNNMSSMIQVMKKTIDEDSDDV